MGKKMWNFPQRETDRKPACSCAVWLQDLKGNGQAKTHWFTNMALSFLNLDRSRQNTDSVSAPHSGFSISGVHNSRLWGAVMEDYVWCLENWQAASQRFAEAVIDNRFQIHISGALVRCVYISKWIAQCYGIKGKTRIFLLVWSLKILKESFVKQIG